MGDLKATESIGLHVSPKWLQNRLQMAQNTKGQVIFYMLQKFNRSSSSHGAQGVEEFQRVC